MLGPSVVTADLVTKDNRTWPAPVIRVVWLDEVILVYTKLLGLDMYTVVSQ